MNVSSSRAPPPNVTTMALRRPVGCCAALSRDVMSVVARHAPVASRMNSRRVHETASAVLRRLSTLPQAKYEEGVSRADGNILPASDRVGHRAVLNGASQLNLPE